VPLMLATEYAGEEILDDTKVIFTPDGLEDQASVTEDIASALGLDVDDLPTSLTDLASRYADLVINPPSLEASDTVAAFSASEDEHGAQLAELYNQVMSEVPA